MTNQEIINSLNEIINKLNLMNKAMLATKQDKKMFSNILLKIYKVCGNDSFLDKLVGTKFKPISKINSLKLKQLTELYNLIEGTIKQASPESKKGLSEIKSEIGFVMNSFQANTREIPSEIFLQIFSFLGPKDKVAASIVCQSWNETAKDKSFWRQFLLDEKSFLAKDDLNTLLLPGQSFFDLSANLMTSDPQSCYMLFTNGDPDDPLNSVNLNRDDLLLDSHFASYEELMSNAMFMSLKTPSPFCLQFDISKEQLTRLQKSGDPNEILKHVSHVDYQEVTCENNQLQFRERRSLRD